MRISIFWISILDFSEYAHPVFEYSPFFLNIHPTPEEIHFLKTVVHIQNVLFENGLVIFGKRVCIFKVQKGLSENPEGDIQRIQKANSQNRVGAYSKTKMGNIRKSQLPIFKNRKGQCSKIEMVIIRKSKWAIFKKQEGQYSKINEELDLFWLPNLVTKTKEERVK